MVACSVWKRMLRLIDVAYVPNVITWGNVFWMDVNVDQVKDIPYSSSNQ